MKSRSLVSQESTQIAYSDEENSQQNSSSTPINEMQESDTKEHSQRVQETIVTNTEFYDEFHLSMSNIQLVLINKVLFGS